MFRTTLQIDGMACGMCEAHMADTVRRVCPKAKKVSASHKKGTVTFLTEETPDESALRAAVDATGYRFLACTTETYEKKGLFR